MRFHNFSLVVFAEVFLGLVSTLCRADADAEARPLQFRRPRLARPFFTLRVTSIPSGPATIPNPALHIGM